MKDIDFSCPSPTLKSAEDSVPTATANLTDLMANLDVHQSCKTTPMLPSPPKTNLLDLFGETQLPPPSSSDSPAVGNSTVAASKYDPLSELSMLNSIFNSKLYSPRPSMALSLMDTVDSIQVPLVFSKFPVSPDCENKVWGGGGGGGKMEYDLRRLRIGKEVVIFVVVIYYYYYCCCCCCCCYYYYYFFFFLLLFLLYFFIIIFFLLLFFFFFYFLIFFKIFFFIIIIILSVFA